MKTTENEPSDSHKATEADYEVFLRLAGNKDFRHLVEFVEKYLHYSAYELLGRNFQSEEKKQTALNDSRGSYKLWREILRWINSSGQMLDGLKADKKEKENE